MKKLAVALLLLASGPSVLFAQADTSNPARVAIYGIGDTVLGRLVLGSSTIADAKRVLDQRAGLGRPRDNPVAFRIGSITLRPRLVYAPPWTMHQLYFENDTLVLVVDGMPHGLPSTRDEFMRRFPQAQETRRESGWYELQTPLNECIWLVSVFSTSGDTMESSGYARVCSRRMS